MTATREEPCHGKCKEGPNVLVTSRKPDDLPAFCGELVAQFQRS